MVEMVIITIVETISMMMMGMLFMTPSKLKVIKMKYFQLMPLIMIYLPILSNVPMIYSSSKTRAHRD